MRCAELLIVQQRVNRGPGVPEEEVIVDAHARNSGHVDLYIATLQRSGDDVEGGQAEPEHRPANGLQDELQGRAPARDSANDADRREQRQRVAPHHPREAPLVSHNAARAAAQCAGP